MSRSPFAYPLVRNIDGDAGGAADLQTDIMRFMAILSLCLMAIFALVQSIPIAPVETPEPAVETAPEANKDSTPSKIDPPVREAAHAKTPPTETQQNTVLTRPKWQTTFKPMASTKRVPELRQPSAPEPVAPARAPEFSEPPATAKQQQGFTLRFESDQALMRLVATHDVGLYAIEQTRSQRMTVAESRISFWDASTPNVFHEMESATVPQAVRDALQQSGAPGDDIAWGVTLPGELRSQLDSLMQQHSGGALVIGLDGKLRREES